jgi:hypothetical protein
MFPDAAPRCHVIPAGRADGIPSVLYFGAMSAQDPDAIINELRDTISNGQEWYPALMQAVREWPLSEEVIDGERFVYMLDGEALDLLRLCERLALSIEDLVPVDELLALLANDRPPGGVARRDLKELVGHEKYRSYLTFIYGVLVEEMVVHAVLEDLRKRRRTCGLTYYDGDLDDAYSYVYGSTQTELVDLYRQDKGIPRRSRMTLTQMKEFTYWLFKMRLRNSDKSRVASDTKRALTVLHRYTAKRAMQPL